eukprot:TRINITY_DN11772_c0_g1_i1.p2 TRINITY_DN11772_c0_g1~~TRINITY_DN11772_c0_g1_i1.p2  ORF type:complete len:62 (-),score=9.27 TRINITY_DN11772_c0_g1_i1:69-254(-)
MQKRSTKDDKREFSSERQKTSGYPLEIGGFMDEIKVLSKIVATSLVCSSGGGDFVAYQGRW